MTAIFDQQRWGPLPPCQIDREAGKQCHTTHGAHMVLQSAGPDAIVAEASACSFRYRCEAVAADESVVADMAKERFSSALAGEHALAASWSLRWRAVLRRHGSDPRSARYHG